MPRDPNAYDDPSRRRRDVSPPDYMDEFGGRHHQPARSRPRYEQREPTGGGMRGAFAAVKDFIKENSVDDRGDRDRERDRDGRPRRAKSHREPRPRPPPSDSDSVSPPPRRRRERDSSVPRQKPGRVYEPEDDYDDPNRPQRRRRAREDEYYSDSRHDRPRRDAYDDRPPRSRGYDERPPRRRGDEYDYDDRYDDRPRRRDDDRYDDRRYGDRGRRDRDRDRYDDRMLRDGRRSRGGKDVPEWQRQAKDMFYTHALPVIKREGPKLIMKYAGDFMGKQGGSRR